MPQLFIKTTTPKLSKIKSLKNKIQIKSWWRQLKESTKSNESANSDTSSHTTLDWRSLSPDRPPLPFLRENSPTSSTTSIHNITEATIDSSLSSSTNNTLSTTNATTTTIPNKNISLLDNLDTITNNSSNKPVRTNTDDRNYQPLCPILEESETMITESSESNVIDNSRLSPSSMQEEEEEEEEERRMSSESGSSLDHHINRNREKQPMPKTSVITADAASISSSSLTPDIKTIQKTPSDKYMSDDIIGDEDRCKRKFAKMVLAANKFQTQQEKDERPSHMALLFDVHGNIDMMRMVRQGKSEYHRFCGNSQYVPPELSIDIEYHSELADIWVLGVFLYRMLIGKYPFAAPNDQQLFKKMLHGNFSIPTELSEDAKDLLRRMLAPDMNRASLDLVIHHPWLKSYRPSLLDHYHSTSKKSTSQSFNNTTLLPPPQQQRNTTDKSNSIQSIQSPKPSKSRSSAGKRFIKKAISLLVQGPFPPPKKPYRDLSHLGTRETVFARQKV